MPIRGKIVIGGKTISEGGAEGLEIGRDGIKVRNADGSVTNHEIPQDSTQVFVNGKRVAPNVEIGDVSGGDASDSTVTVDEAKSILRRLLGL